MLLLVAQCTSQVKVLIANDAFCKDTAQSKTGIFHDYGVAEAQHIFQRLPQEQTKLTTYFSTTPTGAN
jgi:hypothetical protein